jgi:predicted DCC family thiol-disulfide oxidoreductase YuxK
MVRAFDQLAERAGTHGRLVDNQAITQLMNYCAWTEGRVGRRWSMSIPRTFYNANCPVCSAGVAHICRLTGGGDDLRVGVPAFAALWDETPRYRRLARIVRLPVVSQGADVLYELLAIVLYAWNKRREQRQARACRAAVPARGAE